MQIALLPSPVLPSLSPIGKAFIVAYPSDGELLCLVPLALALNQGRV